MNAPRIASLVVTLILTASADVVAQQESLVAAGAKVRVSAPDFKLVGTAAGLEPDTLLMESRDARLAIPLSPLAKLEVHRGRKSNTGNGALIGFVSGAVIGAAMGAAPCPENAYVCIEGWEGAALGGGVLGAVGAGLGALVGAVMRTDRWEEVPLDRLRVGLAPQKELGLMVSVSFPP